MNRIQKCKVIFIQTYLFRNRKISNDYKNCFILCIAAECILNTLQYARRRVHLKSAGRFGDLEKRCRGQFFRNGMETKKQKIYSRNRPSVKFAGKIAAKFARILFNARARAPVDIRNKYIILSS